jgi:hypothetical protein
MIIEIHRLPYEVRENKISWLAISSKVEGTVVSETQGEIQEWSEEWPPHAITLKMVRNDTTLNKAESILDNLIPALE